MIEGIATNQLLQAADKQTLLVSKVCNYCRAEGLVVVSRSQFQRVVVKASRALDSLFLYFQMCGQSIS